jgi:GH15 family glucan-1,4-alpha-glucosidase
MEKTMRQTLSRLWVQTEIGGLARYEDDYYFRRSEDIQRVPGNPWIICTLWAAQFYIEHASETRELETPLGLLMWAADRAAESGVLPEQVHPYTGEPLSVSPLTWSHAEFVATTLLYLDRRDLLAKTGA